MSVSDWIAIGAAAIATTSLVTWWFFTRAQSAREEDQALLEQLVLSLERAYDAIAPIPGTEQPLHDRLAWLTAARHFLAYGATRTRLRTSLYRLLCDEQEEFWRHRLYLLTQGIRNHTYFDKVETAGAVSEQIDPTSAAIVIGFSDWPPNKQDPLDSVDLAEIIARHELLAPRHWRIREYLRRTKPDLIARLVHNEAMERSDEG